MQTLLYGLGYGAVRNPIANAIQPLSSKLPFGQYNDEIAMIGVAWGAKTFFRNPMIAKAANVAMIAEAVSVGSQITAGTMQSNSGSFSGAAFG